MERNGISLNDVDRKQSSSVDYTEEDTVNGRARLMSGYSMEEVVNDDGTTTIIRRVRHHHPDMKPHDIAIGDIVRNSDGVESVVVEKLPNDMVGLCLHTSC